MRAVQGLLVSFPVTEVLGAVGREIESRQLFKRKNDGTVV
jgi:hypothetical protein